jgi:hypothetical protein
MDGAKTAATAGVKQGLEEALLQIIQKHHHQSFTNANKLVRH